MKKHALLLLLGLLISQSILSQMNEENLLGTWKLFKIESRLKNMTPLSEDPNDSIQKARALKSDIILEFQEDKVLNFTQRGSSFKTNYDVKDSILKLGNRHYKIIKLSDSELILKDPEDYATIYDHYQKTSTEIGKVPEFEDVEEHYPNGQLKFKGQKHNGFDHGKWEEWHENGQKKKERYFLNGVPTGTWKEWDKNGKLLKTKKW